MTSHTILSECLVSFVDVFNSLIQSGPEKNTTEWNEQLKINKQLVLHPHAKIESHISRIYWVIHHFISHNYIVKERPNGAKILRYFGWNLRWFNSVWGGQKSIFSPKISENPKFRGGNGQSKGGMVDFENWEGGMVKGGMGGRSTIIWHTVHYR